MPVIAIIAISSPAMRTIPSGLLPRR